jgi:hypothetical protein
MTTYQKQKQRIADLTADIITLIENKDMEKVTEVKFRWHHILEVDKAIWFGETNNDKSSTIGIRNMIKNG